MNAFTPRTTFLLHSLPTMTLDDMADMTLVLADQAGLTGPAFDALELALDRMLEARADERERLARNALRDRRELDRETAHEYYSARD